MAKGDGSIISIERDVWRVFVYFGRDPITNKQKRISRTVHGTKRDARKERDRIRRELEDGLCVDAAKVTFRELAEIWQKDRDSDSHLSKKTLNDGRYIVKQICKYIGNIRIQDLDVPTIEALFRTLKEPSDGKTRSNTTLLKYHIILKQILNKAVDYDWITKNPCNRVKAPHKEDPERRALSTDEARCFYSCIDKAEQDAYEAMDAKEHRQQRRGNLFGRSRLIGLSTISSIIAVRIGLATGMRLGEVLGLTWECVDLNKLIIKVEKSLSEFGELKDPKSKAGIRQISIDSETANHLNRWKNYQRGELRKLTIKQLPTTHVCCSDIGSSYGLSNFQRWWRDWRAVHKIEGLQFHELRHTQATQLLSNGTDIVTVSNRLGHSKVSQTLDCYAHAVPENDKEAAALIGDLFKPKENIVEVKTA